MAIREEEYAILAFGMEWIVSRHLRDHPGVSAPRVYTVEGRSDLSPAMDDLVYWWHETAGKFSELQNEARIDLLRAEDDGLRFERRRFRELGLEIESLDHNRIPRVEKWKFTLSRVGLDRPHQQGVAHFQVTPECDETQSFGTILVVGWEQEGTMRVLESFETRQRRE